MEPAEVLRLAEGVSEALILLDPEDRESLDELVLRLEALGEALGGGAGDALVVRAIGAAHALLQGRPDALRDLEKAVAEARSGAERAVRDETRREPSPQAMPLAGDADLLRDFVQRAGELLDDADANLLALEADPLDLEAANHVFRSFHTIKGMAGFLGVETVSRHAHDSETLLADARNGQAVSPETSQALFSAVDRMRDLVAEVAGGPTPSAAAAPLPEAVAQSPVAAESPLERSSSAEGARSSVGTRARAASVRVDESRLDALLDTIGELVIAESMASAAARSGADRVTMALQLDRLDKITRELQQMATSLRMVPLRATFARMARLVRDLARKQGKLVDLVISGEDAELDKVVVDRIQDPLVHALRNAVDHGLETPEERRAAGKAETGRLELRAYHAGGAVHVDVVDDGQGLDAERIVARARERGLLGEDERPDDRMLFDLVFQPGFSTCDELTDVSGRGVGMDVVKRTVDELRGRVELKSKPGEGTALSVRLPVTLAIIDGMTVRVGEERYILPMLSIDRTVRPKAGQVTSVAGRGEMLALDDALLPVVRLHRLFGVTAAEEDPTEAVVIITSDEGARAGLLACELLGQQQTVIKPLGDGLPDMPGVAGGAIMPDGRVGLILDTAGLVHSAHARGGE